MAPKYKLTYFDVYGAAEPIRFIFAYLNLEYEDVRVNFAEWQALKPTMPYRKMPVLEIDDKVIPQSKCIARYLAKQFGLAGKDDWESLQCDSLVDTLTDFLQGFYNLHNEKDQQKKDDLKKQLFSNDVPYHLGKFDKIIDDNPEGYLVGSQVSWADLFFAANLGWLEELIPGCLKSYPALNNHLNKISNIPGVKVWIKSRPPNATKITL